MHVDINYSAIWANPELPRLINLKKIAQKKLSSCNCPTVVLLISENNAQFCTINVVT